MIMMAGIVVMTLMTPTTPVARIEMVLEVRLRVPKMMGA
jgi:hypothetical protein